VAVGVVLDGDPIEIDGVNPWGRTWHDEGEMVTMRHPYYPTQEHPMPVYSMTHGDRTITFAAGELSNQVWGFFRPVELPD
jgi:hypothetical protein